MIILIGGYSCTGKTAMSQKLLEKYKIPYLSMDHLKMGLYRSNKECGFTPMDSEEVIADKLWPIVREMIKTAIENEQHLVIEGCYILPSLVDAFDKQYLRDIISVYIGFSNRYIKEKYESNIIGFRSVVEKRIYPEDRPISHFINKHEKFRHKCGKDNVKYFEIDNNYEDEIKRVYEYIDNEIQKRKLLK
ncbi:2-phosphoglycerate kinase [Clostridiaceae bacterium M8S5]|nr:2-phosphoglycerate kinase [Clostridiaceae bacterium M8S5]